MTGVQKVRVQLGKRASPKRRAAAERAGVPGTLGVYACTTKPHRFKPLAMTNYLLCVLCFGGCDDSRHT